MMNRERKMITGVGIRLSQNLGGAGQGQLLPFSEVSAQPCDSLPEKDLPAASVPHRNLAPWMSKGSPGQQMGQGENPFSHPPDSSSPAQCHGSCLPRGGAQAGAPVPWVPVTTTNSFSLDA